MKPTIITFVILTAVLVFSQSVSAHLSGGEDKVVGNYLIDFGYEPKSPEFGKPTTFSFELLDQAGEQAVRYDRLRLDIFHDQERIANYNLVEDTPGKSSLIDTLPAKGLYTIEAEFLKNNERLVKENFEIDVSSSMMPDYSEKREDVGYQLKHVLSFFLAGIAIGIFLIIISRKFSR